MRKYDRTKKGVITKIYGHQVERSRKKWNGKPSYSKEWLSKWLMMNPEFHRLYDIWVLNGYSKETKPSVDRIDNHIGYTEYNIQLMTFSENKEKGHNDCKRGNISSGRKHRAVSQYSIDGKHIRDYISANEASRITGIGQGNISSCVSKNKKQNTAGGFKWIYKN